MGKLDTAAVSKLLRELAQRLELAGDNFYRARAYGRAADNLALSPLPLERLVAEGRLTEIPGIGDALAGVITQLHETGHHPRLEVLREDMLAGVLDMLRYHTASANARQWSSDYGLSEKSVTLLVGQAIEYEIASVGEQSTVVARVRKSYLPQPAGALQTVGQ